MSRGESLGTNGVKQLGLAVLSGSLVLSILVQERTLASTQGFTDTWGVYQEAVQDGT